MLNKWLEKENKSLKRQKMLKTTIKLRKTLYEEKKMHDIMIEFSQNQKKDKKNNIIGVKTVLHVKTL